MKAILLDDEPLALRQLEAYAAKTEGLEVVAACSSAREAAEVIDKADVLFADINMPDMSGLDFVRSLDSPPLIVFTTASADYAVEGFRVNAVDYLLKPFSLADFQNAVERVNHVLSLERVATAPDAIRFKADRKNITVPLDSICYVESMSEYIKLHLDGEDTPLVVLYSLRRLMEQLPPERFMRIHRSYIISTSHIPSAARTGTTPVRAANRLWLAGVMVERWVRLESPGVACSLTRRRM